MHAESLGPVGMFVNAPAMTEVAQLLGHAEPGG